MSNSSCVSLDDEGSPRQYLRDTAGTVRAALVFFSGTLSHFARIVDDAKCIVVTRVCVYVCVSVCLSAAACLYCTDPDVTWGVVGDAPLVVHYWAELQSVNGLRCYGNITRTRNVSEYMLVLALCLVLFLVFKIFDKLRS